MANAVLMPPTLAATSLCHWQHGFAGTGKEVDVNQLLSGLVKQVKEVCDGSVRGVKSRLLMQATVLEAIFFRLNTEAVRNITAGGSLEISERLLKLAFRAQSQGRATDETLALIENPRALFIAQQNNSAGHEQVNKARAGKAKPDLNKLLGEPHEKRMDAGATGTPSLCNPPVATMDTFDRTKNERR